MPPIPIYANSPVATKPSGVTPQTASAGASAGQEKTIPASITASPTQSRTSSYPEAKPGAVPSLPAPTGSAAAPSRAAYIPPTPTQGLVDKSDAPPPPQPGAQPTASRTAHLPPPPKDGEKYVSPQSAPAPSYPQQMSIPPPTMAYPAQQSGTMSAAPPPPTMYNNQVGASSGAQSLEHPPGYHQNADASELDRYQQSAIRRNESGYEYGSDDEGVWNSAKKWAQATGEKLVAAETEVWKRINKQ
ncbi:hypothetical protein PFICI_02786 [Pestalotiopsis fici W106-1]|uniref:Uncharacterized protein n=1 Tax=Pestalotiopsis fici (strain W106-1 / CGMCC3.15140) TaxID=1229662 RepID=W3XHS4_PESFW|nr:uncharacterized protein PFICI_02786 [Pestalotiopsis fici W106-1]ETS84761.1 hypothetical protein PFICI_02786 [Pestalotiopsis fici W106-1]